MVGTDSHAYSNRGVGEGRSRTARHAQSGTVLAEVVERTEQVAGGGERVAVEGSRALGQTGPVGSVGPVGGAV